MKVIGNKMNFKGLVAGACALGLLVASQSSFAAITGSAHDFATGTSATYGTMTVTPDASQICIVCHAPHSAPSGAVLLWNRTASLASYSMYTGLQSGNTVDTTVGSTSKLCLSCHDGTIAISAYNSGGTPTGAVLPTSGATFIGTDLAAEHPIGVSYAAAITSGGFKPATQTWAGGADTTATYLRTSGGTSAFADSVECNTCHDVHNSGGFDKLLREDLAGSLICLNCHDK